MIEKKTPYELQLFVCTNLRPEGRACCSLRGSDRLRDALKDWVKKHGLQQRVRVSKAGCLDLCEQGPNIMVFPGGTWYSDVTDADLPSIIERHLRPLVAEPLG
ncbi:MAG: (2Fe-2S) ferredoxin domain-containing protein [Planctomycetes bacterium]|nr:(2Fe-2S) ferredoxin domain-containing protein [Planctomycetota bacterium]MBI3848043.1 (2Fe-2S) ferredoxin domain-containing protein [Planctomycetota bacterium]